MLLHGSAPCFLKKKREIGLREGLGDWDELGVRSQGFEGCVLKALRGFGGQDFRGWVLLPMRTACAGTRKFFKDLCLGVLMSSAG